MVSKDVRFMGQVCSSFNIPTEKPDKRSLLSRISIHAAVFDYEGDEPRHGTRVSSLAEVPFFDPQSKSRRESLGLDKPEDFLPRKEIIY
jgi:hypothetical protein